MAEREIDWDGGKWKIIGEKKIDGKTFRILEHERQRLEQKKIKCENCGRIHDLGRLNELISKHNQFENEEKLAIKARNYGKVSRILHKAVKITSEMVDITSKADYICKKCNRFSANLYIDFRGVKNRISTNLSF